MLNKLNSASLRGISLDTRQATLTGRKAAKIGKEFGLVIGVKNETKSLL